MAEDRDRARLAAFRRVLAAQHDASLPPLETMVVDLLYRPPGPWTTDAVGPLAELEAVNRAHHIEPTWAPSPYDQDAVAHGYMALNDVAIRDEYRNAGLGRFLLTVLEQALCMNPDGPQVLRAVRTHLPLFYVADGHYHWVPIGDAPADATPNQRFPRWFISGFDDPRASEKMRDNYEAIYADTDLGWATPLAWHRRRCEARMGWSRKLADHTVPLHLARYLAGHDGGDGVDLGQGLHVRLEAVSSAALAHVCKTLGNLDDPTPLQVRVDSTEQQEKTMGYAMLVAFLVDHGRVMYRPLQLGRPPPAIPFEPIAPYFSPEGTWVPRKKPHSTTYRGDTILPHPPREEPPGRMACVECGQPARWTDTVAFHYCQPACSVAYYSDDM